MFSLFKSKRQKWKEPAEATFANYIPSLQGMDGHEIGFVLDLAAKIARASTITLSDNEPYVLAFGDPLRVKQDDAFRYLQYWKETMIADGATEEGQAKVGAMSIWWLSLMGGTIPEMRSKTKVMWNELERGFKYCEVFIPDRMVPAGFGLDHYLGLSQVSESHLVKPSDNAEPSDADQVIGILPDAIAFASQKWIFFVDEVPLLDSSLYNKITMFSVPAIEGLKNNFPVLKSDEALCMMIIAKGIEESGSYSREEIESALGVNLPF
jgi:hypothetical protein